MTHGCEAADSCVHDPACPFARLHEGLQEPAAQAELIARLVAERLGPNCGSLVVPDAVAAVFAEISRKNGGAYLAQPFWYSTGLHNVMMHTQFTQRGSLVLSLDLDSVRIWSGELRAAASGS